MAVTRLPKVTAMLIAEDSDLSVELCTEKDPVDFGEGGPDIRIGYGELPYAGLEHAVLVRDFLIPICAPDFHLDAKPIPPCPDLQCRCRLPAMISESPICANPITGGIGVEIGGIDLRQPISDELTGALRDALDRYLLVVFRNQFLDMDQHYRLAKVFGAPCVNAYAPGPAEHPEMTYVIKEADERTGVFGGGWHTDLSFIEEPPNGSVLCAIEVPPYGGDTLWANQRAAWRALPEPLKQLLDGRDAIHVGKPYGVRWAPPVEEQAMKGSTRRGDPEADKERFHPAVLTHPRSGERSLYVNPTYTMRLDGLTEDESRPILAKLFEHATLPEFSCRLRWSAGTIAVWDNYSTQHYAIDDYAGFYREMRRITFQATGIADWRG